MPRNEDLMKTERAFHGVIPAMAVPFRDDYKISLTRRKLAFTRADLLVRFLRYRADGRQGCSRRARPLEGNQTLAQKHWQCGRRRGVTKGVTNGAHRDALACTPAHMNEKTTTRARAAKDWANRDSPLRI